MGLNILDRDNPWDFKIELSNKEIFNLEITSIADEKSLFKKVKAEDRLMSLANRDKIPFFELKKIYTFFPSSEIAKLIGRYNSLKISKTDLVDNPFKEPVPYLFYSSISEDLELFEKHIVNVIDKKIKKKHFDKSNTILLIDNRTITYELDEVLNGLEKIDDYINDTPFKEIWFYTGYYSDWGGNDSEYSLIPLKISEEKHSILERASKKEIKFENIKFIK